MLRKKKFEDQQKEQKIIKLRIFGFFQIHFHCGVISKNVLVLTQSHNCVLHVQMVCWLSSGSAHLRYPVRIPRAPTFFSKLFFSEQTYAQNVSLEYLTVLKQFKITGKAKQHWFRSVIQTLQQCVYYSKPVQDASHIQIYTIL